MRMIKRKFNRAAALLVAFVLVFLAVGRLTPPVYAAEIEVETCYFFGSVGGPLIGSDAFTIDLEVYDYYFDELVMQELREERYIDITEWFSYLPRGLRAEMDVIGIWQIENDGQLGLHSVLDVTMRGIIEEIHYEPSVSITIPARYSMSNNEELILRNAVSFDIADFPRDDWFDQTIIVTPQTGMAVTSDKPAVYTVITNCSDGQYPITISGLPSVVAAPDYLTVNDGTAVFNLSLKENIREALTVDLTLNLRRNAEYELETSVITSNQFQLTIGGGGAPVFGPLINNTSTTLYENIPYKITLETDVPNNEGLTFTITPALPEGLTFIRAANGEHPAGTIYGSPLDYNTYRNTTTTYTVTAQGANAISSSAQFMLTIRDTPTQRELEEIHNAYPITINPRTGRDGHIGTFNPATGFYEVTGSRYNIGNLYMYIGDRLNYTNGLSNFLLFDSFWLNGVKLVRGVDYTVDEGSTSLVILERGAGNLNNGENTAAAAYTKPRNLSSNGLDNDLDIVAQTFVAKLDGSGAVVYGDLDGSGDVGNYDLLLMLRFFAQPGTVINQTAADVNGDGKLNNADLIEMLKHFSRPGYALGPR